MSKPKILIVDDSPINCKVVSKLLDRWGFSYQVANSAMEAFGFISDKSYSIVLMDIEMPVVSGLEAAAFIRKLPSEYFQTLPVIAMTANRYQDIAEKAFEATMNDVLTKPIDAELLFDKLSGFI